MRTRTLISLGLIGLIVLGLASFVRWVDNSPMPTLFASEYPMSGGENAVQFDTVTFRIEGYTPPSFNDRQPVKWTLSNTYGQVLFTNWHIESNTMSFDLPNAGTYTVRAEIYESEQTGTGNIVSTSQKTF
jgi:hypothetical protein